MVITLPGIFRAMYKYGDAIFKAMNKYGDDAPCYV